MESQVWLADCTSGKVVLKLAKSANKKYLERERDLCAIVKKHDVGLNVAEILEVGESDGWAFAAREYIDGSAINEICDKVRADPLVLYEFTKQVSSTLAVLHAANIIHCDLKPGNIIAGAPTNAGGLF